MRGVLALLVVGGVIVLLVVGVVNERRWSSVPPAPVPPGWTDVGTDTPA